MDISGAELYDELCLLSEIIEKAKRYFTSSSFTKNP